MQVIFKSTVSKELEYPQSNADCFAIKKNTIALSDGASMSFASNVWATILVNHYGLSGRTVSAKWLDSCRSKYNLMYEYDSMNWLKQAAYAKGSHATFLSLKMKQNIVEITAVGDTVAFIFESGNLAASFPLDKSVSFNRTPELLSTNQVTNGLFTKGGRLRSSAKFNYVLKNDVQTIAILMTDALAEWVLKSMESGSDVWRQVFNLKTDNDFIELIINQRDANKINIDDSTIIIADLTA